MRMIRRKAAKAAKSPTKNEGSISERGSTFEEPSERRIGHVRLDECSEDLVPWATVPALLSFGPSALSWAMTFLPKRRRRKGWGCSSPLGTAKAGSLPLAGLVSVECPAVSPSILRPEWTVLVRASKKTGTLDDWRAVWQGLGPCSSPRCLRVSLC